MTETMSAADFRGQIDLSMTERQFQDLIVAHAKLMGWNRIYHTHDSRRSEPGFPDLFMIHRQLRLQIAAEVKTEKGRLSKAQREWLLDFEETSGATQGVFLWRPSDWDDIKKALQGEWEGRLPF